MTRLFNPRLLVVFFFVGFTFWLTNRYRYHGWPDDLVTHAIALLVNLFHGFIGNIGVIVVATACASSAS